jgi:hypothetical protein
VEVASRAPLTFMEDQLLHALAASAVPVILGGALEHLKLFLEPLQPFRDRVKLKRTALIEQLAAKHANLIRLVVEQASGESLGYVIPPKGEESDTIGGFMHESFRMHKVCNRLEALVFLVQGCHWLLMLTALAGLAAIFVALFFPPTREAIVTFGLVITSVQICAIFLVKLSAGKLDVYEDIA